MTKHTFSKLAYFVGNANGRGLIRIEHEGLHIASMVRGERSEAYARLFAAAPDLLEALEAIVESGEIPYCYSSPLVLKAKAAIAKARGEPK